MAEASSPRTRSGGRRRRLRRSAGPDGGLRCDMCGRQVAVDVQGRCPLGHAVVDPTEIDLSETDVDLRDRTATAPPSMAFSIPAPTTRADHGRVGAHQRTGAAPPRGGRHEDGRGQDGRRQDERDDDVVAVYREPSAAQVRVQPAMDARPAFSDEEPSPSAPVTAESPTAPVTAELRLPVRLTRPLGPAPDALEVPSEEMDDDLVRTHADNAAAFAAMVTAELTEVPLPAPSDEDTPPVGIPVAELLAPSRQTRTDRLLGPTGPVDPAPQSGPTHPAPQSGPTHPAPQSVLADGAAEPTRVSHADLSPDAVSSLDISELPVAPHTPEPRFEQWPVDEDVDLEPPRTWGQRVLGALFVALLLALAWWLATSL